MDLTVPEYFAQLNAAKDLHLMDWDSPTLNAYEKSIGMLKMLVSFDPRTKLYHWFLNHERRGLISKGESEDRDLAKQEVVTYAMHHVRKEMAGLLA